MDPREISEADSPQTSAERLWQLALAGPGPFLGVDVCIVESGPRRAYVLFLLEDALGLHSREAALKLTEGPYEILSGAAPQQALSLAQRLRDVGALVSLFPRPSFSLALGAHVARNPGAPPGLLWGLATSHALELRRAVAQNPNAPLSLLVLLGAEFPAEIFANPGLALALLADPESFERIDEFAREQFLHAPLLPGEAMEGFANYPSPRWRASLARNPRLLPEVQAKLVDDPSEMVRVNVAENPETRADLLRRLARADASRFVRESAIATLARQQARTKR
jgi:hypothetical protein